MSRSCTDEGWTPLEPGPYPVACGLDDNASSLDEVGLSAPHTHALEYLGLLVPSTLSHQGTQLPSMSEPGLPGSALLKPPPSPGPHSQGRIPWLP